MKPLVITPIVSEKAVNLANIGIYMFEVPTTANKIEIAREVAGNFKVTPVSVNILVRKGKLKNFRRIKGRQSNTKQAFVKLAKGQSIKLFETGDKAGVK